MLDYDAEADGYDATRGGQARAWAAAQAVDALLPSGAVTVLDIAGGTGLVGAGLSAAGRTVLVSDESMGMLRLAASRHPGRVVRADARQLPLSDAGIDAVSSIWLLHLLGDLDSVGSVIAEVARILRPGGHYVTTVDKTAAHRHRRPDADATDARATVLAIGAAHGLAPTGEASFIGIGQGRPGVGDGSDPMFPVLAFRKG